MPVASVAVPREAGERFSSFVFACLVFAAINGIVWFCVKDSRSGLAGIGSAVNPEPVDKTFMAWTTRDWLRRSPAPEVVLMGSSQMAAASFGSETTYLNQTIDCVEHRDIQTLARPLSEVSGHGVQVFNWSQSGAMISDDYLIAANLFNTPHKPEVIVLGVSPRDFIDNTLPCAGSTEAFRFFARYFDLNKYVSQAFPDFMSRLACTFDSLPAQKFKEYFKLELRSLTDAFIIPGQIRVTSAALQNGVLRDDDLTRVEPGKWCISANMPPYRDNTTEYLHRYKSPYPAGYELQRKFFEEYLSLMRGNGVSVMVVAMPSLSVNRALLPDQFWNQWRNYVSGQCNKYGGSWLDLSSSKEFAQKDYLDTVHLNAIGGRKLMGILLSVLENDLSMKSKLAEARTQ